MKDLPIMDFNEVHKIISKCIKKSGFSMKIRLPLKKQRYGTRPNKTITLQMFYGEDYSLSPTSKVSKEKQGYIKIIHDAPYSYNGFGEESFSRNNVLCIPFKDFGANLFNGMSESNKILFTRFFNRLKEKLKNKKNN